MITECPYCHKTNYTLPHYCFRMDETKGTDVDYPYKEKKFTIEKIQYFILNPKT